MTNQIKKIKFQMLDLTYRHLRENEALKRINIANTIMHKKLKTLKTDND